MAAEGYLKTEVGIVGGGPGGLYTALSLARLGIRSVVLEKGTFPRRKVCGDILTSNVLRALHDLDPELITKLRAAEWAHQLNASSFASARGAGIEMPFHSPSNASLGLPSCIAAPRLDFDAFLADYVREKQDIRLFEGYGVREIERRPDGFVISGKGKQQKVHCRLLVLALGANSPLVRQLVPGYRLVPKDSAVGIRMYYDDVPPPGRDDLSEFYLFERKLMPGGLYVTPFGDRRVNVNIVMRHDIHRRRKVNLRQLMDSYLESHPQLVERFAQARATGPAEGCVLFFGTRKRRISSAGCLLVGDAAGITDATNANGIGHAMISGGIAANTLALALETGLADAKAFRAYDQAVYARLKNALLPGKVMRFLFANRLAGRLSAAALQTSFKRLNSHAIEELVYSSNTARTLINPKFYWRLFAKQK